MRGRLKWIAALMLLGLVAACSLPRGAALQEEILVSAEAETARFQLVPVTRDTVDGLLSWPATGWHGHYHWPSATRGGGAIRLRPGDRVDLTIWDSQDSSLLTTVGQRNVVMTDLRISPAGTLFVPYVEEITVSGLTADEARARIQDALEPIVPSAQVQLRHEPGRKSTIDVVRGVARPGSYPLPDQNYPILSLLSDAGGVPAQLRNPLVRLLRDQSTYEISLTRLLENDRGNILLRGGDTLTIEEDQRNFIALGATGRETQIFFQEEELSTLKALALVGGLSDARADLMGVLILRTYPESALRGDGSGPEKSQVVFNFDLTTADGLFAARAFPVYPDDVLIASESPITSLRTVLGLVGATIGVRNALNN